MNYILPLGITIGLGILFIISYFIFMELKINRRMLKIAKEERELLRVEKEYDRNEAIRRGLLFFQHNFALNSTEMIKERF